MFINMDVMLTGGGVAGYKKSKMKRAMSRAHRHLQARDRAPPHPAPPPASVRCVRCVRWACDPVRWWRSVVASRWAWTPQGQETGLKIHVTGWQGKASCICPTYAGTYISIMSKSLMIEQPQQVTKDAQSTANCAPTISGYCCGSYELRLWSETCVECLWSELCHGCVECLWRGVAGLVGSWPAAGRWC